MTPFRLSVLSVAVLCSIAPSFADQTSPVYGIRDKTPNLLAFTNATVHTEPGKMLSNATVLVQSGKTSAEISSTLSTNSQQTLTGEVGVNLDEEAARLIQYQQSYQAAAKMLQVAQKVFDILLETSR